MTKLATITTSYSSFENDQVLTATQLNTFLNYFDDQDRMSRVCLSGVGIVCGFKIDFDSNPVSPSLILSQGAGITTDGDLIHLLRKKGLDEEEIDFEYSFPYTKFSPFVDDKAFYPQFLKPAPNPADPGIQIPLWELLFEESMTGTPLSELPNLKDKVVLLYLESYNDDADLCVGINCDNLGVKEVQRLRVLLVSQDDANYILSQDTIFNAEDLIATYLGLEDVVVPRVVLNEGNTTAFTSLRDSYKSAITADYVVDNMKSSFTEMLGKLNMSTEANLINTKLDALFGNSAVQSQPTLYFQYRYDALKDIVDTYMEMKEMFLYSNTEEGCPDIKSFPKHLMLGKLDPTPEDTLYKRFRHSFYKSPILGEGHEDFEMFQNLVTRIIQQLNTYIATNIPRGEIKITPSRFGLGPLGDEAIPFYYKLQNPLLNSWNYEKMQKHKQRRNLSYHTALLESSNAIQKPLKYNLEPFNFLRIEGHQGYLYQEAMEKINTIKNANGLSFDLKALGITISPNETIDMADYECEFADLNTMLKGLRSEHECILANTAYYLSSYSVVRPNLNDREVEFFFPPKQKRPLVNLTDVKLNSAIIDNLNTGKDTTGRIMLDAFKTNDGCSANDMIAQINLTLSKRNFSAWDKVLYDATIEKPSQILSNGILLLENLPVRLKDLNRDKIAQYAISARNITGLTRKVKGIYTGEINPTPAVSILPIVPAFSIGDFNKDYSGDYLIGVPMKAPAPAMIDILMAQLAKITCSTKQLETIMDEIEARKQRILLSLKLSKFIEKHPGLEHFAGTRHGGTFLLVYLTTSVSGIPANTVVADFSLPYLCCSDCNSVNFIMPRPIASLTLSQDRFCIGNDTSPLVFTPYPANGIIKADRVVPGLTINGNQLLVNPLLIPNSILGTPIYFTVNEQVTGCNLTIYKSPQVNFNVPESPTTQTEIPFQPIGLFDAGTTFLWNFGDGHTSTQKFSTHQYAYPVNEDNKVTVSLTVVPPNGACPTTVKKDITFLDYQVTIEPKEFCNNDTTVYPFIVIPEDSHVSIGGDGVVEISEVEFGFKPSEAAAGKVTIFVNDAPWMELTVKPNPLCNIVGVAGVDGLSLTSNMSDVLAYIWSFENAEGVRIHPNISNVKNPFIPWDDFESTPDELVVKLYVTNACSSYEQSIIVHYPIDFATCSVGALDAINNGDTTLVSLMASDAFALLTAPQRGLFETVKEGLFDPIIADPTPVLSGSASLNGTLANSIADLLNVIQGEIVTSAATATSPTRTAQLDLLTQLYALCGYMMFPSIIRCQNESDVDLEVVADLFSIMVKHLDPAIGNSFPQIGVDVDPDDLYVPILNAVLDYRRTGTLSWNSLNQIIGLIG